MFPSPHPTVAPVFRRRGAAAPSHPLRSYARDRKLQFTVDRAIRRAMSPSAGVALAIGLALAAGPVVGFGSVLVSRALERHDADAPLLSQVRCADLSDSELLAATEGGRCALDIVPAAGPAAD